MADNRPKTKEEADVQQRRDIQDQLKVLGALDAPIDPAITKEAERAAEEAGRAHSAAGGAEAPGPMGAGYSTTGGSSDGDVAAATLRQLEAVHERLDFIARQIVNLPDDMASAFGVNQT